MRDDPSCRDLHGPGLEALHRDARLAAHCNRMCRGRGGVTARDEMVVVTGATGRQEGAVSRHLVAPDWRVRGRRDREARTRHGHWPIEGSRL